jgi:hypothetical protein
MLPLRLGLWQLSAKVVLVTPHQMFLEHGVIPRATLAISSIAHVDCHGHGPEYQKLDLGVSSCYEIGTRVYDAAKALYVGVLYRSMWKSANNYRMTSIARRQRWLIPASDSTT